VTENKAEHFVGNSRSETLELLKLPRNELLGQIATIANGAGATPVGVSGVPVGNQDGCRSQRLRKTRNCARMGGDRQLIGAKQ
jgi:hypothetical protein